MTILDDLLGIARERHFGHETSNTTERELCRISRVPIEWCHGCRKGLHKYTRVPLPGTEDFELPVAEVVEVAPVEITPTDATPPVIDAPTEKFTDVDLAAGPVEGVKKIWADRKLVYDALEQSLKQGVDEGRKPDVNFDPTPWCSYCGARKQQDCHCGPIADNE